MVAMLLAMLVLATLGVVVPTPAVVVEVMLATTAAECKQLPV